MLAISRFFSGDMAAKPRRRRSAGVVVEEVEDSAVVEALRLVSCMVEAPVERAAMLAHALPCPL
jgi:hypothetical protein